VQINREWFYLLSETVSRQRRRRRPMTDRQCVSRDVCSVTERRVRIHFITILVVTNFTVLHEVVTFSLRFWQSLLTVKLIVKCMKKISANLLI